MYEASTRFNNKEKNKQHNISVLQTRHQSKITIIVTNENSNGVKPINTELYSLRNTGIISVSQLCEHMNLSGSGSYLTLTGPIIVDKGSKQQAVTLYIVYI